MVRCPSGTETASPTETQTWERGVLRSVSVPKFALYVYVYVRVSAVRTNNQKLTCIVCSSVAG